MTIDSRTADASGKILTECVKNMNGLLETENVQISEIISCFVCFNKIVCGENRLMDRIHTLILLLHARFWLSFVSK